MAKLTKKEMVKHVLKTFNSGNENLVSNEDFIFTENLKAFIHKKRLFFSVMHHICDSLMNKEDSLRKMEYSSESVSANLMITKIKFWQDSYNINVKSTSEKLLRLRDMTLPEDAPGWNVSDDQTLFYNYSHAFLYSDIKLVLEAAHLLGEKEIQVICNYDIESEDVFFCVGHIFVRVFPLKIDIKTLDTNSTHLIKIRL